MGDKWTGAGAEQGDLGLDFLKVFVCGFEVDLDSIVLALTDIVRCSSSLVTDMFDSHNLSCSLLDGLIYRAETAT